MREVNGIRAISAISATVRTEIMATEPTECRSPEGKTEGLADSLIGIVWVLADMDLTPENVKGALQDFFESP